VFEFFKVAAPERVGFAKHCEAAERKAAALAAADTDAGETATSPRATPTKRAAGKTFLQLLPPPPPRGGPRKSVVAGRRSHPQQPREPESWTSRLVSSRT
jgi:hypothetical protein